MALQTGIARLLLCQHVPDGHLVVGMVHPDGVEAAGLGITLHRLVRVVVAAFLLGHAHGHRVVLDVVAQEVDNDILDEILSLLGLVLRAPDLVCLCLIVIPCGQQTVGDELADSLVGGYIDRVVIVVEQAQVLVALILLTGNIGALVQ